MVWQQLTDHLQVLYGAVAALAIVLVLTPAVGRTAQYLRLVERPAEGERARSSIPRLGGLAMFLGVFVPALAFMPLGGDLRGVLLGAAVLRRPCTETAASVKPSRSAPESPMKMRAG